MGLEFPGDENKSGKQTFRFACEDTECPGSFAKSNGFRAKMHEVPEFVPSGCPCPFGGDHDATWLIDKVASVHVAGGDNPFYTTAGAESEHKWMELQIEEARKAVEAEDQLTGNAASPYSKVVPNYEEMEKKGMVKRDDTSTSEQKQRIRDERAKIVAEDASDKIDREIEQRHIGNRHDG